VSLDSSLGPSIPHFLIHSSFSARLEGDSKVVKPNQCCQITVSFTPRQRGVYEAVLELTFYDHKRSAEFIVKRILTGLAIQSSGGKGHHQNESARSPGSRSINDCADDHTKVPAYDDRELLDSDGTGITVSHAHGLDFGIVERKRPNGPFATPSSVLTIKHADGFPVVTFVKERTRTLNGSDPEFVVSYPRPCLYSSLH
jgi:hypothetical protein